MQVVILSIHLLVCVCLIGLVLLQRSEGGALGIGGGGGGSLMSGRGASDALARLTSIAGALFLGVSLLLTWISGGATNGGTSVFDALPTQQEAPLIAPAAPAPAPAEAPANEPDPTQSSLPTPNELAAAIMPGPAPAAAAPPQQQNNAARAAPLDTRTQQARTQQAAVTPAPTQQRNNTATQQRAANTQTQSGGATNTQRQQQLIIPNTSGAVSGVNLDEPNALESGEIAVGGVEAVRRTSRAGPDQ